MSRELDVSPWEALTTAVRIAAARVHWLDGELRQKSQEHDGAPTHPEVLELLRQSRAERKLMAATAKAAIDAGVAERLVRQVELEGQVLADALDAALRAVGAGEDQRLVALEAAHRHLAATVPDDGTGVWAVPGTISAPLAGGPVVDSRPQEEGPEDGTDESVE